MTAFSIFCDVFSGYAIPFFLLGLIAGILIVKIITMIIRGERDERK
jgi:hypothetical protein